MSLDKSLFSIVVPIYNEEESLPEVNRRISALFDSLDFNDCEAIFVSDGSFDNSENLIRAIATQDRRFKGIFLTRNFGHQAAVSTGLQHADGSVVAIIDGDLQDPPELLPKFIAALESGADVAYGVRRKRKENWRKRLSYWAFYRLLRLLSQQDIPMDAGDFCCMSRRVATAINSLPENRRFLRGLRSWVGFCHVPVKYERKSRDAGRSKYGWALLFRLAYDGLFSFSDIPVKAMQVLGFVISFLALLTGGCYFVATFLTESPIGFPTLVISIWLLAGLQMFFLGILGEYMHRTYEQVLGRPSALVREFVGGQWRNTDPRNERGRKSG